MPKQAFTQTRSRTGPSARSTLLVGLCVLSIELGVRELERAHYVLGIVYVLTGVMWILVVRSASRR